MSNKIKALIVDDSAVVRQTVSAILSEDKKFGKIVTANDPYNAVSKLLNFLPDVIILDIEMPRMDGLTFLKKLMTQHTIPVVICSSLSSKGSETALKALEYGAVDIIEKASINTKKFLEDSSIIFRDIIKAAAKARVKIVKPKKILKAQPKLSADVVIAKKKKSAMIKTTEIVVAIGASTGGTEALKTLLEKLPMDTPGIVIVQHMPENFTKAFANRLNETCLVTVKEAQNNDSVLRGHVLIAPGNHHVLLRRSGARYYVEVKDGPLVCRHRPSVDVLFRSVSQYAGQNAIGIIMTGMGEDGARGLLEMRENGAKTYAQDEASSVVFGMPKKAIEFGAVDHVKPLEALHKVIY